ncbi:hypothetical protein EQ500_03070, partial [Lactobacillus sp. XV13L]|nr:hypothetical protein [Lactobacillus sp. XV13L]
MKFKILIIAVVALITFGTIGQTTINHPNNIQAKTNSAVFPKKMRGTWYHYDNDTKQVEKYVYTKKKRISYADYKKVVNYLHAKPKNDPTYP